MDFGGCVYLYITRGDGGERKGRAELCIEGAHARVPSVNAARVRFPG